jgi:hypothetical protein
MVSKKKRMLSGKKRGVVHNNTNGRRHADKSKGHPLIASASSSKQLRSHVAQFVKYFISKTRYGFNAKILHPIVLYMTVDPFDLNIYFNLHVAITQTD